MSSLCSRNQNILGERVGYALATNISLKDESVSVNKLLSKVVPSIYNDCKPNCSWQTTNHANAPIDDVYSLSTNTGEMIGVTLFGLC